jgi:hypothetical protein
MNKTLEAVGLIGLIIIALVLLLALPFANIWALNTLFVALAIPYNFWTWLASAYLGMQFFGSTVTSKFNKG